MICLISSKVSSREYDDLVDTVQELRPEVTFEFVEQSVAHVLVVDLARIAVESDRLLPQFLGAEVGGHDDHHVLEVHRLAMGIGQSTVLQNLKEDVENVGVSLFDLIKQHHRERTAPDSLGELSPLVVSHIAGR